MTNDMSGPKKIYVGSDHAGYPSKALLVTRLKELGFEVDDLGPDSDSRVDYPDFADKVCLKLKEEPSAMGLLICGSGQGMAMRANKYSFIRAALCWNEESAKLSRQHNDANILCLGARLVDEALQLKILECFFKEDFEGGRHQARVEKISSQTI